MDKLALIALAKETAIARGLDPALVCAVVEQESGWNTNATRFEPAFKVRYVDPQGLSEPEATYRATSYGLMQVMGQVARENGFLEDIPMLCDPAIGLAIGCKVLARKLAINPSSISAGLLAYNGGSNAAYPPEVLSRVAKYSDQDVKIV